MMTDAQRMTDAFTIAMERARELRDEFGIVGYGVVELRDPRDRLKLVRPFANLITNQGDTYYANMGIALVQPQNNAAPTLVAKMKLGTGTTGANKAAGTNEVIQTYITGSVVSFDATFPQKTTPSANSGALAIYKTTWVAGVATNAAITEATITSSAADAQGAASDTISRVTFTAVPKGALDTLAITWNHKFLGA